MEHLWWVFFIFLPEDKVWTIVNHNLPKQSTVVSNKPEKHASLQLNYNATMDQISAITSSAEYCEQLVSYFCKLSRLLNTPGRLQVECLYCFVVVVVIK